MTDEEIANLFREESERSKVAFDWLSFARAVAARERERCAKVCEEEDVAATDDPLGVQECIAKSIRALGDDA